MSDTREMLKQLESWLLADAETAEATKGFGEFFAGKARGLRHAASYVRSMSDDLAIEDRMGSVVDTTSGMGRGESPRHA